MVAVSYPNFSLVCYSNFFPSTSFSIRLSSMRSPTSRFNSAFSRSSARRRLASATSIPPNWRRHRYKVCSAILCWRQTSWTLPTISLPDTGAK